jgi:5'-phosphate synthase pdxT subunit
MKTVGVLALQGDFEAHARALQEAGAQPRLVRKASELAQVEALVIPGGESTTMLRLLEDEGLFEPLREFGRERPIFGTCAGAILLASDVFRPAQPALGLMDIAVERNAYGRQIESRVVRLQPEARVRPGGRRRRAGGGLHSRAHHPPHRPRRAGAFALPGGSRACGRGTHMAATFHPELSVDRRVHRLFLRLVEQNKVRAE